MVHSPPWQPCLNPRIGKKEGDGGGRWRVTEGKGKEKQERTLFKDLRHMALADAKHKK